MIEAVSSHRVEVRRARVREEILDAAWSLCREAGLASLSLRAVAARLGMRAPSLYTYFDAKDAIYDAMFAQGQRALEERMAFIGDGDVTRAAFRRGSRVFFDFCIEDPTRYQLLFQRTIPGFEPSSASYALAVANLDRFSRQLRAAGVRAERHLDLWTAMMTGLVDQQLSNDPGGQRWRRILDEAVDLFCDHVGIPPNPPNQEDLP